METTTSICFTVPAVPIAQPRQQHRVAGAPGKQFVQNFTPTKHPVNAFKASCRNAAWDAYDGAPLDGPLKLTIEFVMPRPRNRIWKTKPMPRELHSKRPDLDNLEKSVMDALSGLVWVDDSQVAQKESLKVVAGGEERPHVVITVEAL